MNEGWADCAICADQDLTVFLKQGGLQITSFNFSLENDECNALRQPLRPSHSTVSEGADVVQSLSMLPSYQHFYVKSLFAALAGNDYINISGVGPETAAKILRNILDSKHGPLQQPDVFLGPNLAVAAVDELQKSKKTTWVVTTSIAESEVVTAPVLVERIRLSMLAYELQPVFSRRHGKIIPYQGPHDR